MEPDIVTQNLTHEKILTTALALFTRNGYDATAVAEICQAADVSKGAFYYHFPSKQALFLDLMKNWLDQVDAGFNTIVNSSDNVVDGLIAMAGTTGRIFQDAQKGFPILVEFWRQANLDPLFWQEAVTPYQRYLDYFESMVKKGMEENSFDNSIDPKIAARLLLSLAMGFLLQASLDPATVSWAETTKTGMQLLIQGLRRKK